MTTGAVPRDEALRTAGWAILAVVMILAAIAAVTGIALRTRPTHQRTPSLARAECDAVLAMIDAAFADGRMDDAETRTVEETSHRMRRLTDEPSVVESCVGKG